LPVGWVCTPKDIFKGTVHLEQDDVAGTEGLKRHTWLSLITILMIAVCTNPGRARAATVSDQDITDAYHYLIGRLLVLRQEQLDLKADFKWNQIVHRDVGGVAWANPNLDVAYSEAWIAIDQTSCTLVTVPEIKGRYYTVQALNGWGETVANINERNYAKHPFGTFAFCLKGSKPALPAAAERVNLPNKKARLLIRVELGADPETAIKLQHQITLAPTGTPKIDPTIDTPIFTNDRLPGVEAFDKAAAILAGEPDINPGMKPLQKKVLLVAKAAADPQQRSAIDIVVQKKSIPSFFAGFEKLGTTRNGWNRPTTIGNYGKDYEGRSLVDLAGIWANNNHEAVYYKTNTDGQGQRLDGSVVYTMTFPRDQRPEIMVRYFWSVVAVDSVKFQVIDNPLKRYLLNNQSNLQSNTDGTLTLIFADKLPDGMPQANWLPTPTGQNYNLTFRFYGPNDAVESGQYFPPPLVKK
jgi:hypothetical protein